MRIETKKQASNRHILEFWVVLTVAFFVGNPGRNLHKSEMFN